MKSKITQQLMCDLTESERREYGIKLAIVLGDIEEIEAEKKKQADHFKDRIAGKQASADELSRKVRDNKEWRDVDCEVILGEPDREHKQTVRLDTGEVIRTERMSAADLQLVMPLEEEEAREDADTHRDAPQEGDEGWVPAGSHDTGVIEVESVVETDGDAPAEEDKPLMEFISALNGAKTGPKRAKLVEGYIGDHGDESFPRLLELARKWGATVPTIAAIQAQCPEQEEQAAPADSEDY